MDIYFHGFWRMDWGLGNPNKTAALIATLMIAVWGLVFIRKWGFWVALALFTGLGICLIHTFSRGGMVALAAGLAPLLWIAPRPWPRKSVVAVTVAAWIIVGASICLQANSRYLQGIVKEDRSISHRLDIWKMTPQMMVDAPGGWGFHQAIKAYQGWYQPLDRNEAYLNLINSHLTWLVEIGWVWRFLYFCGWLAVFSLCWPRQDFRWFSIPLGIWLAFAIASIFTHVADIPWLWILPAISFVSVLVTRIRKGIWMPKLVWPAIAGVSAVSLLFFYWIGSAGGELKIHGTSREVILGTGNPKVWITVNPAVMGEGYAKTLRRYLQESKEEGSIGIVSKVEDVRNQHDSPIVVAGALDNGDLSMLKKKTKLVLLNPTFYPQEVDFNKSKSISVYFGEFSQSPALEAWRNLGVVHMVEGKGDFLANWPELVFDKSRG